MLFLSRPSPDPRKFQDTAENIFFFPRKVCSTTTVSSLYPFYIYIYFSLSVKLQRRTSVKFRKMVLWLRNKYKCFLSATSKYHT